MDNYDFFNTFITAVGRDSAIEAWCKANFGRSPTVFADVESTALPAAENMPYLIFHTPGIGKHQERREQAYSIAVDLGLDKSALEQRAEPNVKQPSGIQLVLDMATLIVAAVKAALPSNTVFGFNLSADTLGALPEVYGYMDLDFTTQVTIAGDPLA